MDAADKRMLDREALRNMIQQWNANRLDLFELSEPNENLEFHGVMRFYFQDSGQKIATKCIRVASDATVSDVIETLIEKFRPDMRMLSLGSYSLWETHGPDDERRLEPHEKPLLVQLNWHADDREGRFLLKCLTNNEMPLSSVNEKGDQNFKRKLSKREKKELKKKEKLSRLKSDTNDENRPVAEKLYTELPETSFTRSISNPEAVMRRRRQQKLERKLQQFRSKDGGPDTGGTLKIYGSSLCPDVPYKTLLLSVGDTAAGVVREMLDKYGLARHEPHHYCIVQVDTADNSEYILEDDECPLAIVMTHPHHSSIMFHVRRRPTDAQPRRRKKKTAGAGSARPGLEPALLEVAPDGAALESGRRVRITEVIEIGSGNGTALQLYGPSIQPRHCVLAPADGGGYSVTPLHADALVYVNGRRVVHTQRLQHGCLVKFGRVSTFRFVDPAQENIINRNLSQSQHFGSGSIYDRSPSGETSGAMSPTSMASHQADALDPNANVHDEYPRTISPVSHDTYAYHPDTPYNNNTLKLDNESLMMSQHLSDSKDDYMRDEHSGSVYNEQDQSAPANRMSNTQYKDNYETTFDLEGNVETKSICSAKSGGSGHDNRSVIRGQEAILPAVLEFPEAGQAQFLAAVISRLDPHAPAFKLAPVYTLYLCARYRASTHYRPELTPTERAHKLTAFLHHVATLIHATVQERCTDSAAQAFWMANASELLHFLKCDRHISSFSTQAQDLLPTTVQNAFSNLVSCFQEELSRALAELTSPHAGDATDATAPTLQALAAAMVLLRRCRVNAALTIQLFSHLFHYINAVCFNKLVTEAGTVSARWGGSLSARLALVAAWAERQGLELAADCHLARTHQAARLISGTYRNAEEVCGALGACFKLNSVQVRALLTPLLPPELVEAATAHARARADELYRADGREIMLEESVWLGAALLIPGDGFSAEVVRGVPPGLAEFVAPLQRGGLCRLAHQPHALGLWTVYMHGYGAPTPARPDAHPAVHIVQLHKNSNGMGLSIVAAKGAGQSKLGIYIKSVVAGGAAAADGRLAAGDQLLSVDGHSLVGITQEKAAEYLVRTGPTVTLEVAKQGAVLHGLATLLHQPAYNQRQEIEEVQYEDRARRNSGTFTNLHPALLRPTSPLTELVTAGERCHTYRHRTLSTETSESSTDETDTDFQSQLQYRGSIPRLIITLDHENDQLQEDQSPSETPGCPLELKDGPAPPYTIPVFTFTCEDTDAPQTSSTLSEDTHVPIERPPLVPEPPAYYDQSSDQSGEIVCLPPEMKPIDTKLTLDLFNSRTSDENYRRRCTAVDECVSACECCRTPQPETQQIPFIDEPNSEPVIFENDVVHNKVATPKIRRILPSLSLDRPDEKKPETADAMCQTPTSPLDSEIKLFFDDTVKKIDLKLDLKQESKSIENIHSRLRKTIFTMTKSVSKSDDTEIPSTSTSESFDVVSNDIVLHKKVTHNHRERRVSKVIETVEKKSWKSPDEFRPAFGKVKALAKHFNQINLKYCVKNYKRNCQSSPNLSARGTQEENYKIKDSLPTSASLADIQFEQDKTDTDDYKTDKMSEDEVKSILIQLEDWSKFGSRGSEDTLAQGNEFELPNLPSEDHTETNVSTTGSFVFNEIVDKKPKKITLDNIKLKSNRSSISERQKLNSDSIESESLETFSERPMIERKHASSVDISCRSDMGGHESEWALTVQSCPDVSRACAAPSRTPLPPRANANVSAARRASERDLPSRLAAEPVKPSKSTPALHALGPAPASPATPAPAVTPATPTLSPLSPHPHSPYTPNQTGNSSNLSAGAAWAHKSRSSHNLLQSDSYYQNLHQPLQDRWSSLRSSTGSGRPQSAHFAATNADTSDTSSQHQLNQSNAATARAAKLAEMSEEVTRRQQQQQQQFQQQQQQLQQSQQRQMQQQQIQHQQQHQHLQQLQQHQTQHQHLQQQQVQQQQIQQQHQIQQQQQQQIQQQQQMQQQQQIQQQQLQLQQQAQGRPLHYSPQLPPMTLNMHQYGAAPHYNAQHQQGQRYEWHPAGPPSPQRSQPPVAPKPMSQATRRSDADLDEQYLQQQQPQMATTVQPDDERYVASASEPPAVAVYPAGGAGGAGGSGSRSQPAHNPWQREERERQAEARRAAARARRDATIAQLVSLGGARTPVQNQQLRALQLERDFERRATQHQDDNGGAEGGGEEESPSPEPEPEQIERQPNRQSERQNDRQPERQPERQNERQPPPPKSILKTNPRTDLTNGYSTYTHTLNQSVVVEETRLSEMSSSMANMSVGGAPPPPPPERGSSFAVMASRAPLAPAALAPPHAAAHAAYATHATHATHAAQLSPGAHAHHQLEAAAPPPLSPVSGGRDKRVSFHERAAAPPAPPASSPPPLEPSPPAPATPVTPAPAPPREDPDRFIDEAASMLAGPVSPGAGTAPAGHTPGVIGAQEVYRDPRTRRLAEAQARAPAAPVPEQLSFKEKMKMFALESGEPSTPKDKVKISRAQRDIDAVH